MNLYIALPTKLRTGRSLKTLLILLTLFTGMQVSRAQDTIAPASHDTLIIIPPATPDTLIISTDSISGKVIPGKSRSAIDAKVDYKAVDSISFNIREQKVFLYNKAVIDYEDIQLKAARVEINFKKSIVSAKGVNDTTGKEIGTPEFKQASQTFRSKTINYNYKSRKGLISNVITKEGEGYLHGTTVKKLSNGEMDIKNGSYTTCSLDEPHFEIKFTRAKVIPGNKIITGPAYMAIESVPLPVGLPFGMFPNKKGQSSGILIPTYGEAATRGFYLENGGYYWGISDYMDLKLVGDVYSRGSWALKPTFNYRKRYRYNGSFNFSYAINVDGEKGSLNYVRNRDFRVTWSHRQDPKARPNSVFAASVNAGSSKFDRYNPAVMADHLSNQLSSSISYDVTLGPNYRLSTAARHSQNTTNKTINITLPEVSFSANQFYPFRSKTTMGRRKWYEDISVKYNMNARNELNTFDSLLFRPESLKQFKNGMQHTIPVSSSVKVLKYFTMTNSVNYTERWYTQYLNNTWIANPTYVGNDTINPHIQTDTLNGFKAARDYSFNSNVTTTVYGMVQFKKGPLRAIRHVMNPSAGFSMRPDFGSEKLGYYKTVQKDTLGNTLKYSIFNYGSYSSLYGTPPIGKSGNLNFGLNNNLEIKVRSLKDTITGTRKLKIIESLRLAISYNIAADSLNWSPLSVSGNTTLFKNFRIQYSGSFDPYVKDTSGIRLNQFEWDVNHRLFRPENSNWNLGFNWNLNSQDKKKTKTPDASLGTQGEIAEVMENPEGFIDWNNPWSLNFSYTLNYIGSYNPYLRNRTNKIVQTLGISGDLNITPKWKISVSSGYDFENHKRSITSLSVHRDLHCWEMRFNWIPDGYLRSWNFQLNIKSALLQDLKLKKKKDFRDSSAY